MKLVFVAFDNVSHQPKSTNMISMTQYSGDYIIDSAYVNNIKSLDTIYNSIKPDVFFIDSSFSKKDILEFLTEFQKKKYK